MRIFTLYLTSIICGFCMMALEILGGRLLQPVFGSSIDVWAAIISVFILSLSIGYVLGGRIADRSRTNLPLAWMILISGAFYCLMCWYGLRFSNSLGETIQTARWGVLFGALVLFLPPSLLLGSVSPMLVKLVFTNAEHVGRTTGTLYAIGSLGNVLGILVTDYLLLEHLELTTNLLVMGTALGALGIFHLFKRIEATIAPSEAPVSKPMSASTV
ncbi:MAG: fused MFS/spermidine synthase [Planctomycetes bacterium]|nr:fused MFS/spermidine synthase [Planctomycetota bacterium]